MEELSDLPIRGRLGRQPSSLMIDPERADGRSERIVSALRELREAMDEITAATLDDTLFLPSSSTAPGSSDRRQEQVEALLPTLRLMRKQMKAATVLFGVILGDEENEESGMPNERRGRNESVASDYGVQFEKKWF